MTAVFVDTNVLVYSRDVSEPHRRAKALAVLRHLGRRRTHVSVQVLSEYANALGQSAKLDLGTAAAIRNVRDISASGTVLPVSATTVLAALEAQRRWGLSYWDAQIWATAAQAGVHVVLSEDFADGLELGGVRFADPFAEGFDLDAL